MRECDYDSIVNDPATGLPVGPHFIDYAERLLRQCARDSNGVIGVSIYAIGFSDQYCTWAKESPQPAEQLTNALVAALKKQRSFSPIGRHSTAIFMLAGPRHNQAQSDTYARTLHDISAVLLEGYSAPRGVWVAVRTLPIGATNAKDAFQSLEKALARAVDKGLVTRVE